MLTANEVTKWNNVVFRVARKLKHSVDDLARLLGDPMPIPVPTNRRFCVDIDKEWIRDALTKLDGPHYKTLLKVMEIRNVEKREAKGTCED